LRGSARTVLLNLAIVIVVLAAAGIVYYFYYQANNYVSTSNAVVTATTVPIASPVAGVLTDWSAQVNTAVGKGDVLGHVQPGGATATPVSLTSPIAGTVVQSTAVPGEVVAAGAPIAYVSDLADETITAYVPETSIRNVKVGQSVDVYVDAYPNTTFSGTVTQIAEVGASTFSLIPTTDRTSGNFSKVTENIAVTISIGHTGDLGLAPGMNARVRIHI
jgi:multidrug resistance efflux pump